MEKFKSFMIQIVLYPIVFNSLFAKLVFRKQLVLLFYYYCRSGRPRMVYWAMDSVRGQEDTSVGVQDNEWAKGSSLKVLGSMSEDKFHLGITRPRSKELACC